MRKIHDKYFKQAKREGRLARSFYKLEELDRRAKLLKPGDTVLDLGACPGSWLEYILGKIGEQGIACAVDLNPVAKRFKGKVRFFKRDILKLRPAELREVAPRFDAVLSDMAPATSGVKSVDQTRSLELCEGAAKLAQELLAKGGRFVCKVLEGPELKAFRESLRPAYKQVRTMKPDASREESMETYLVCTGFGEDPEEKRARPDHQHRKTKGKRTRPY